MKLNWKLDDVLPYGVVVLMLYYGCPMFISDTGSAMAFLLAVIPVGVFVCGFVGGQKKGLMPLFPVLTFLAILPQYFIMISDWEALFVYGGIYTLFGTVGMVTGWILGNFVRKKKGEKR